MRAVRARRRLGMSLPELVVSSTIFGLVVVGSTSSALLLAKIASDHENRADFSTDIRIGMEQMSFDVRNADSVKSRYQKQFTLVDKDGYNVRYKFDDSTGIVSRTYRGDSIDIFTNVITFDVLKDEADAPSGMTFDEDEIGIETLEFEANNATSSATNTKITKFTIRGRNL